MKIITGGQLALPEEMLPKTKYCVGTTFRRKPLTPYREYPSFRGGGGGGGGTWYVKSLPLSASTLIIKQTHLIYCSHLHQLVLKRLTLLLYRLKRFTGKYATCKIHTKPHPGLGWRILHILTSEDIDYFADIMFAP